MRIFQCFISLLFIGELRPSRAIYSQNKNILLTVTFYFQIRSNDLNEEIQNKNHFKSNARKKCCVEAKI